MGLLILIPRPETSWSAADRVAGRAPVPLTDAGRSQVRCWTEQLEHNKLGVVYSSDEQPTKETAQLLAHICGSRHKIVAELAEVDDYDDHLAKIKDRLNKLRSPFRSAEYFEIEEIIDPRDTRENLCRWANIAYRALTTGPSAFTYRP